MSKKELKKLEGKLILKMILEGWSYKRLPGQRCQRICSSNSICHYTGWSQIPALWWDDRNRHLIFGKYDELRKKYEYSLFFCVNWIKYGK